jgi:hypothetical protein
MDYIRLEQEMLLGKRNQEQEPKIKPESTILALKDGTSLESAMNGEDITATIALDATQPDSPEWKTTIRLVVTSVVSIHFCKARSFDTDPSTCSQATGFVVDADKGYILTNRHVVGSGPFWGYCIFYNHEQVRPPPPNQEYCILTMDSAKFDLSIEIPCTILGFCNSTRRRLST